MENRDEGYGENLERKNAELKDPSLNEELRQEPNHAAENCKAQKRPIERPEYYASPQIARRPVSAGAHCSSVFRCERSVNAKLADSFRNFYRSVFLLPQALERSPSCDIRIGGVEIVRDSVAIERQPVCAR